MSEQDPNVQTATENQPSVDDFIKKLVELKGNEKFSDPNEAAKSAVHATEHIQRLEAKLQEMEEKLSNQKTSSEMLAEMEAKAREIAEASKVKSPSQGEPATPAGEPENVEAIVSKMIEEREKKAAQAQNQRAIEEYLQETFGDTAGTEVTKKATELGYSPEQLVQMGIENPSVFKALMGFAPSKATNAQTASSVNTGSSNFNQPSERDNEYYNKLRRENPKSYYSKNVQMQMQKDALELGDRFFQN